MIPMLFTALALAAGAGPHPASAVQRAADHLVATGVPGAIVVARAGPRTLRVTSGYGNVKTEARMSASDRFRVGSVTKSFVATVVLQLVGEGELALDDTVESRLPGVVPNGDAITIRELLDMTSGLYDFLDDGDSTILDWLLHGNPDRTWAPTDLVAISTRHAPKFAPGTSYEYCNTCYVLLGMIVERATGDSIANELRTRVFRPAGLRATSLDSTAAIAGRHAHGYEREGRSLVDVSAINPSYAWAAGALVSTANDVARFYRALLGGKLLRPDLLAQMETLVPIAPNAGYGFGLLEVDLPCGRAWGHDGAIPGYRTWALNSKDGKHQVVVLANLGEGSLTSRQSDALDRVLAVAYCG